MNIMTGISTDGSSVWGTRYPFHPYPTGWFMVGFSEDVAPKGVKPLRYFARDLVLFRTEDGKAVVADAHCPHLGAISAMTARSRATPSSARSMPGAITALASASRFPSPR